MNDHSWFSALETRGTLSSYLVLLNALCEGESGGVDTSNIWGFGRRLATGMREHPEVRAEVYTRLALGISEQASATLEYAIAEAPDEAGIMILLNRRQTDGAGMDRNLGMAIEHFVVRQRPLSDSGDIYEQVSAPAPSLRKRLFALVQSCTLARACLVYIDQLRDRDGPAWGEPRHPDIESKLPWPMVDQTGLPHPTGDSKL